MYKKVLITGQMRSGTTLLCNFLNSQQGVTMYADIFHTVAGRVPDPRGWGFQKFDYLQQFSRTNKYYILYTISFGIDVLKTANKVDFELKVGVDDFSCMNQLYDLLLADIAAPGDKAVGNKVTSCELNIKNLLRQTDKKVIYIYRDARDVVISASKKFKAPLEGYAQMWNTAIDTVLSIGENANLLCLKFEDLICKDSSVAQKLGRFLGVDINFEIEGLRAYNNPWVANSSFDDVRSIFDEKAIGRWKNNMTPDVEKIYSLCKDRLLALNYEPL